MQFARKRFGQHFLHDPGVIQRIVAAFDPQPGETIVEIGPGHGAITLPLLERAHVLHAIELDRDLAARLPALAAGRGQLVLYQADALRFDFIALAHAQRLRVVGNLPYNISTPLLFHLLDQADAVSDMLFMVQKEVGDRMAALPGSKDYGRLSVMLQWRLQVEHLFDVGPGAFRPPPKVWSSVIRLRPRAADMALAVEPEHFSRVVQAAFAQRRKTLRNSLRGILDENGFTRAGVDPIRRPETLTLEEFAALSKSVAAG